ncbi:MAG: dockerin type I domain-containing protein, partial [Candidatus Diapherotrites archaeon]
MNSRLSIALLLTLSIFVLAFAANALADTNLCYTNCTGKLGDVSGNGYIDSQDAEIILNMSAGITTPTACADLSKDCLVNSGDAILAQQAIAPYTTATCTSTSIKGDVSGDGQVTERDAATILAISVGTLAKPSNICCADISGDGTINSGDGILALQIVAGTRIAERCNQDYCKDSDSGLSYYIKGTTTWGASSGAEGSSTDYCSGPDYLVESYCSVNNFKQAEYKCANGCKDGACVCPKPYHGISPDGRCVWSCSEGTTPDTASNECICKEGYVETGTDQFGRRVCTLQGNAPCTETDGGRNEFVKGTLTGGSYGTVGYNHGPFTDYCNTNYAPKQLIEYFCANTVTVQFNLIECANGCTDGACIADTNTSKCTDSDNGKNYYTKGKTTGTEWATTNYVEKNDYCITEGEKAGLLAEYFCHELNNQVASESYKCPNGCKDGACIADTNIACRQNSDCGTPATKTYCSVGTPCSKETYNEGQTISGLKGTGSMAGKELTAKLVQITLASSGAIYNATLSLYDGQTKIGTETSTAGTDLSKIFLDSGGDYVLSTSLKINTIAIAATTSIGYIEVTKGTCTAGSACKETTTPICSNPGTTQSSCTSTSSGACQSCPYGCNNGACIDSKPVCGNGVCESGETQNNCPQDCGAVACKQDSDCGTATTKKYCSGNAACVESSKPLCYYAGTTKAYCTSIGSGGCAICQNGCDNGECLPGACTTQWDPVCCVDGKTYSNECTAKTSGCKGIAYEGECKQACICTAQYAPVCGVDGKTYPNSCEARCANTPVSYEGECRETPIVECKKSVYSLGAKCEEANSEKCTGYPERKCVKISCTDGYTYDSCTQNYCPIIECKT